MSSKNKKNSKNKNNIRKKISKKKKNNNIILNILKSIKPKKIKLIIIIFLIIIITVVFHFNTKFYIEDFNKDVEVNTEFKIPKAKFYFFNLNLSNHIKTKDNINTNKLGTYKISYKVFIFKKNININIIDSTKPTINLIGNETINSYIKEEYNDEGVIVLDNYDKNIKDKIKIENNVDINKLGTYEIIYTVTDQSGNTANTKRLVNIINKNINYTSCNNNDQIITYICNNNLDVSIGYYNLITGDSYYYKKDKSYYGASLIKTMDAIYLYDKDLVNDNIKPYIKKAISVSDNQAHLYLLNYIGRNNLRNYANELGISNLLPIGYDDFGPTNVTNQIITYKKLYEMTSNDKNNELKSFFINDYYNSLTFDNSPTIMHKYGYWEEVYHESGIVLDEEPYIIIILSNEGYNNYKYYFQNISKLIYKYHKKELIS